MSVSESSHEEHSSLDYNNEVGTGRNTDIPHDALSTCMLSDHAHFDTNLSSILNSLTLLIVQKWRGSIRQEQDLPSPYSDRVHSTVVF